MFIGIKMIFKVSDEVMTRSPRAMNRDLMTLGSLVKGLGEQVVFSSIFPIARSNFSDRALGSLTMGLISQDIRPARIYLCQKGNRILAHELARFTERASN